MRGVARDRLHRRHGRLGDGGSKDRLDRRRALLLRSANRLPLALRKPGSGGGGLEAMHPGPRHDDIAACHTGGWVGLTVCFKGHLAALFVAGQGIPALFAPQRRPSPPPPAPRAAAAAKRFIAAPTARGAGGGGTVGAG